MEIKKTVCKKESKTKTRENRVKDRKRQDKNYSIIITKTFSYKMCTLTVDLMATVALKIGIL